MTILNIILLILLLNSLLSLIAKKNIFYCGIVGFSGKENFNSNAIRVLLLHNVERGKDGTGMWNQGKVIKDNSEAMAFLKRNKIVPEKTFLGHTRNPSTWNFKSAAHAHPFQIGSIVSVHNGKAEKYEKLLEEKGLHSNNYDVDSEALAALLNEYKDDKFSILKRVAGKASLIWIDESNPEILYAFRKNDERPLHRGRRPEGMYISSEKESLELIDCKDIVSFKTSAIYSIKEGKILSAPVIKDKTLQPVVNAQSNINEYEDWQNDKAPNYQNQEDIDKEYEEYINSSNARYLKEIKRSSENKESSRYPLQNFNKLNKAKSKVAVGFEGRVILEGDWIQVKKKNKLKDKDNEMAGLICLVQDTTAPLSVRVKRNINVSFNNLILTSEIERHFQLVKGHLAVTMTGALKDFEHGEIVYVREINTNTDTVTIEKAQSKEWDGFVYTIEIPSIRALTPEETAKFIKAKKEDGTITEIRKNLEKLAKEDDKGESVDSDTLLSETDIENIQNSKIPAKYFFTEMMELHKGAANSKRKAQTIGKFLALFNPSNSIDTSLLKDLKGRSAALIAFLSQQEKALDVTIQKIAEINEDDE